MNTETISLIVAIAFMPTLTAIVRGHRSALAIGLVNVIAAVGIVANLVALVANLFFALLGGIFLMPFVMPFAGLLWFIALVWSLTGNTRRNQRREIEYVLAASGVSVPERRHIQWPIAVVAVVLSAAFVIGMAVLLDRIANERVLSSSTTAAPPGKDCSSIPMEKRTLDCAPP